MPLPEAAWQPAPGGQPPSPTLRLRQLAGLQSSTHRLGEVPPTARAQSGEAVVPFGKSVGQGLPAPQLGEHQSPGTPFTNTLISSFRQPLAGSP